MRLAATCICLLLSLLAFSQVSDNCTVQLGKSQCRNLLNAPRNFNTVMKLRSNYRILIYYHHFQQLNKKQKICVLKKIMGFYNLVNSNSSTTKFPEMDISSLHQDLLFFETNCLKCKNCKDLYVNMKRLKECRNYNKSKVLNEAEIVRCQLLLLKKAKKKKDTKLAEIQEKTVYELDSLLKFIRAAN